MMKFAVSIILCIFCVLMSHSDSVVLRGTYLKINNNIEAVYQLPAIGQSPVKGVLFLAHGCSHSAIDWWPKTDSCLTCIGLPVETSIVSYGLEHGYAMLSISSQNRRHKCWTSHDMHRVNTAINYFYQTILGSDSTSPSSSSRTSVAALPPLHMIGASSGGNFVGMLAQSRTDQPLVASINVQISSIQHVATEKSTMPPVIFSLMKKDSFTLSHVHNLLSLITSVHNRVIEVPESTLSETYFHDHSHGLISITDSKAIFNALVEHKLVDVKSLKLNDDPRSSNWRPVSLSVPLIVALCVLTTFLLLVYDSKTKGGYSSCPSFDPSD
jgi:hypothetical protein